MPVITIPRMIGGKLRITSASRPSARSTLPPMKPEMRPSAPPIERREKQRSGADRQGHARAMHNAREHVAAGIVGAEPVRGRRRLECTADIDCQRRLRREKLRKQRHQHQQREDTTANGQARLTTGAGDHARRAYCERSGSGRRVGHHHHAIRTRGSMTRYSRSTARLTTIATTTTTSRAPCSNG